MGAGKRSALKFYSGSISYQNHDLRNVPADQIVARGIAQVPEGRGIFGNLSVAENLKPAMWQRKDKDTIKKDYERVFALFPRLNERTIQLGGTLFSAARNNSIRTRVNADECRAETGINPQRPASVFLWRSQSLRSYSSTRVDFFAAMIFCRTDLEPSGLTLQSVMSDRANG